MGGRGSRDQTRVPHPCLAVPTYCLDASGSARNGTRRREKGGWEPGGLAGGQDKPFRRGARGVRVPALGFPETYPARKGRVVQNVMVGATSDFDGARENGSAGQTERLCLLQACMSHAQGGFPRHARPPPLSHVSAPFIHEVRLEPYAHNHVQLVDTPATRKTPARQVARQGAGWARARIHTSMNTHSLAHAARLSNPERKKASCKRVRSVPREPPGPPAEPLLQLSA